MLNLSAREANAEFPVWQSSSRRPSGHLVASWTWPPPSLKWSVVHLQTQRHLFRVVSFSCLSQQHHYLGADPKLDPPAQNFSQCSIRSGNPLHSRDNVKWDPQVLLKNTPPWSSLPNSALDWPTDSKTRELACRQQKAGLTVTLNDYLSALCFLFLQMGFSKIVTQLPKVDLLSDLSRVS